MHVFELMDAGGHVRPVDPQHCADDGTSIVHDGATYHFFGTDGAAHAYCTHPHALDPATLLQVALPISLGGGMLYPAPVLWVSETGIRSHYKRQRASDEEGAIAIDDGVETASNDDVMDEVVSQSDETSECGEEDQEDDDDLEDKPGDASLTSIPTSITQNGASWSVG